MASLAAISATTALPSLTRFASGNVLKEKSQWASQSRNLIQNTSKVTCSVRSDDNAESALGSFFQNRIFPAFSSVLIASTLIAGNVPESAIAFELENTRPLMAVVDEDMDRDAYINLLQKFKTEETPAVSDQPASPEERARLFKENLEKKRKEAAAKAEEEKIKLEEAKKAEAEAKARKQTEAAASKAKAEEEARSRSRSQNEAKSSPAKSVSDSKSRGTMPLFLSQFSLLLAFAGVISAAFLVPDSKWKEINQKKEEILAKVLPVVEETIEKIKPVAKEAVSTTGKFIEEAKPVVEKAIEQSKPVVAKAIEQAKPLLEKGQQKAAELIEQAKNKSQ